MAIFNLFGTKPKENVEVIPEETIETQGLSKESETSDLKKEEDFVNSERTYKPRSKEGDNE